MTTVQRFARNTAGRDFIVGDVHGCFDALRDAMAANQFDEARDRLYSVGDLVDRGPSFEEAVEWIARPWFHAVRGNHEQMAIGVARGRHDHSNYASNGGRWFLALPDGLQRAVAHAFDTLPVAIEIDHAVGRIGIVHADVPGDSWKAFTEDLEADMSKTTRRNLLEFVLWSRSRWQAAKTGWSTHPIKDVAAVFVGHTPVLAPMALANVIYVDTCAVFGNVLTMLEIGAGVAKAA